MKWFIKDIEGLFCWEDCVEEKFSRVIGLNKWGLCGFGGYSVELSIEVG